MERARRAVAREGGKRQSSSRPVATLVLQSQSQVTATSEGEGCGARGGWGGAGRRWKRRPAARFVTRAKEGCHRISVKQVLKLGWVRHGYGDKGFPGCRHSPRRSRQRFASMRTIDVGDQSSSGRSSS